MWSSSDKLLRGAIFDVFTWWIDGRPFSELWGIKWAENDMKQNYAQTCPGRWKTSTDWEIGNGLTLLIQKLKISLVRDRMWRLHCLARKREREREREWVRVSEWVWWKIFHSSAEWMKSWKILWKVPKVQFEEQSCDWCKGMREEKRGKKDNPPSAQVRNQYILGHSTLLKGTYSLLCRALISTNKQKKLIAT